MSLKIRPLIVDDSVTMRAMLDMVLNDQKVFLPPVHAANADEAMHELWSRCFNVVLLDINMPGMDGLTLLDHIVSSFSTHVIILSSSAVRGSEVRADALRRGAAACFDKAHCVRDASRFVRLIRDVVSGKYVNDEIEHIGMPGMRATVAALAGQQVLYS